jgi:uncharacterized membrane protein YgcG
MRTQARCVHAFSALFGDAKESVMLLLFGRFKDPARLGLGIVIVIIGIVLHQPIFALVGAVLVVWGLYAVIGARRNRGRNAGRGSNSGDSRDSGEGGQGVQGGEGADGREGGEGRPR